MIARPVEPGDDPDVRALLEAGRTAWSQGRRDVAVRRWRLASAVQPGLAAPYANLAGAGGVDAWVESAAEALACDDPVIFKNLGVLAVRRGSAERGRIAFRRALILSPDRSSTVDAFARSSVSADPDGDGLRWKIRAVTLRPVDERLWTHLLQQLVRAGRVDEAARRAQGIALPHSAWSTDLLDLVSQILPRAGSYEAATPLIDLLIERRPDMAKPRMARAVQYRRAGDKQRAVAEARRAVILEPDSFDALGTVGTELCHADLHKRSIVQFRRSLIVAPGQRDAVIDNYAVSLQQSGQRERGDAMLREQLVQQPGRPKPYVNLSASAVGGLDLEAGSRLARWATVADDGLAEAHYQLGTVRRHQGRVAEARAALARALALAGAEPKPEHAFAKALLELGDGDPAVGAESYEVRWRVPSFPSYRSPGSGRVLPMPFWRGEARPDATLAVWGEQGVGDELWFAGYLEWAAGRVGRILLEVTPHLAGLMARTFPAVEVLPRGEASTEAALAAVDLQVPLGSLMWMSGGALAPAPTGYLAGDPGRVAQLRRRYTEGRPGTRLIGVSWRSVKPTQKLSFEAPLQDWKPILDLPGTVFVSLQYGPVEAEVRRVEQQIGAALVVDPEIDARRDLDAFAAQVAATDAVVSIANSTVAMAHGLGKPMHVLLKAIQEDWRYARHRETTRWLPTARCAWQSEPGNWAAPIALVAERLRRGG